MNCVFAMAIIWGSSLAVGSAVLETSFFFFYNVKHMGAILVCVSFGVYRKESLC